MTLALINSLEKLKCTSRLCRPYLLDSSTNKWWRKLGVNHISGMGLTCHAEHHDSATLTLARIREIRKYLTL